MTRVRFDPSFLNEERWERLGLEAFHLHMSACAYTVATLSDGLITHARIRSLSPLVTEPEDVAQMLLDDGLWEIAEDGRIRVCQALDDLRKATGRGDEQPSRHFVTSEREKAQARKEKWKQARNGVPNGARNETQCSAEQSSAVQDPEGSSPAPAPAAATAVVRGLSAAPAEDGNGVPSCVLAEAPPGTPHALWSSVWTRAALDLPKEQRMSRERVLRCATQLLAEERLERQAAVG